jgi:predicted short-subunit dehydrogenase-like oxidoreductase (DUF2520 family)
VDKSHPRYNNVHATLVGAGNVGWNLSRAFQGKIRICQVYSRNFEKASEIATMHSARVAGSLSDLQDSDLIILSTPDDIVFEISEHLPERIKKKSIVAHTSGISGIEVFPDVIERPAVFYPLNTFSYGLAFDLSDTPIFIDAKYEEDLELLKELAGQITNAVYPRDDEEMPFLHLGAVFSSNFSNHLIGLAKMLLDKEGFDFSKLVPLIRQTVRKAEIMDPLDAQTGPAVRDDEKTMERHLNMLQDERLKEIYSLISKSIRERKK